MSTFLQFRSSPEHVPTLGTWQLIPYTIEGKDGHCAFLCRFSETAVEFMFRPSRFTDDQLLQIARDLHKWNYPTQQQSKGQEDAN